MIVGIDTRVLEKGITGVGRYLQGIIDSFPQEYNCYYFNYQNTIGFVPKGLFQKIISPFWLYFILPYHIKRRVKLDVFFSSVGFPPTLSCDKAILICDVFYKLKKNYHPFFYSKWSNFILSKAIKKADMIATPSEYSKKDILKYYDFPEDRIIVHPPVIDKKFKARNIERGNFILYIGTIEKRKNIEGIIKIADLIKDKISTPIFLFGKIGHLGKTYLKEIEKRDNIKYWGVIEEDTLPQLYNRAKVFLFPSFYEGYGLPIAEAIQSGCPVITSNTSSLPEVVGNKGIMHSPTDYQAFADDLIKICQQK